MKAYKLFRKLNDGSVTSLFINKKERLPLGKWLKAKSYPTKGYAYRPFWHCVDKPIAPHLSTKGRVFMEVEIEDFEVFNRPESQGGKWYLAKKIKLLREV